MPVPAPVPAPVTATVPMSTLFEAELVLSTDGSVLCDTAAILTFHGIHFVPPGGEKIMSNRDKHSQFVEQCHFDQQILLNVSTLSGPRQDSAAREKRQIKLPNIYKGKSRLSVSPSWV